MHLSIKRDLAYSDAYIAGTRKELLAIQSAIEKALTKSEHEGHYFDERTGKEWNTYIHVSNLDLKE